MKKPNRVYFAITSNHPHEKDSKVCIEVEGIPLTRFIPPALPVHTESGIAMPTEESSKLRLL